MGSAVTISDLHPGQGHCISSTGIELSVRVGLEKGAVQSSRTSRLLLWASSFSFSLAQWTRDQASRLPAKSLKEQTKICPGQAKFESYLSQGQAGIRVFFKP